MKFHISNSICNKRERKKNLPRTETDKEFHWIRPTGKQLQIFPLIVRGMSACLHTRQCFRLVSGNSMKRRRHVGRSRSRSRRPTEITTFLWTGHETVEQQHTHILALWIISDSQLQQLVVVIVERISFGSYTVVCSEQILRFKVDKRWLSIKFKWEINGEISLAWRERDPEKIENYCLWGKQSALWTTNSTE